VASPEERQDDRGWWRESGVDLLGDNMNAVVHLMNATEASVAVEE